MRQHPEETGLSRSVIIAALFSALLTICAVVLQIIARVKFCYEDANWLEGQLCAIMTGPNAIATTVMVLLISWIITIGAILHASREA